MEFRLAFFIVVIAFVTVINVRSCDCKAFGPLSSGSSLDDIGQQVYDVATGKRELRIKGNILDGDAEISTSYTDEEIFTMVAIGGGLLLALVCCGVCCKRCCCSDKPSTVIMYQQMPSGQPQHHAVHARAAIPMRNQGFSGMPSQFNDSPPPPYPGMATA